MVTIGALWLPILVSTVLVFVASNLSWMVLRIHKNDWAKLPDEEAFAKVLGAQDPPPGEYQFPYAAGPDDWKSEAWLEKCKHGPVGFLTLRPKGEMAMGKTMAQWFCYIVILEIFVAYLAGRILPTGADYLQVFQIVGTAAILSFAGAVAPEAIWMGRRWSNVAKTILDGVVYGLVTAGAFGWLWPAG